MDPVLKKLGWKGQSRVLVDQAPAEFQSVLGKMGTIPTRAQGKYEFVLVFVKSREEAEKRLKRIQKKLEEGCVFWMAYPKGTSRKYKSDYNRDTGYALMARHGLKGVALISIDEDWSAMRFKL